MASTYTELYYHFVWATKDRNLFIVPALEKALFDFIRAKCEELRITIYALNGMPDHVHLACALPTNLSIAEFMKTIKGTSAHVINHLPNRDELLYWQPGYGALTFTKRDLPRISAYIDNQKRHHADGSLMARLEQVTSNESTALGNRLME